MQREGPGHCPGPSLHFAEDFASDKRHIHNVFIKKKLFLDLFQ